MLQFILGRAASGKSYQVIERIAESVESGIRPILLVPEQFSFESEKRILDRLGDSGAQKVSVLSFTRLCDEVERTYGGICGRTLSDADRLVLISRALRRVSGQLKIWNRYAASSGFAGMMLETIAEFKLNAIDPQDLIKAAQDTDDDILKLKLFDTSLIFSEYNALLAERFIDPSDRLTRLYDTLLYNRYFEGKTVFVDSFKGFMGQQFRIIDRIISQARDVIISFTDDEFDNRNYSLFSNIRKTRLKIENIARAHGIKKAEDVVLSGNYYASPSLAAVERLMCGKDIEFEEKTSDITVCRAQTVYDEADFVARNIRRIVREKGARYSDFVIIARDTTPYEEALEAACKKNDVSCFIDKRMPLSSLPASVALLCAMDVVKGFSTEKILRFHKSGIGVLSEDEIAALENYTYLWGIDGKGWLQEWNMSKEGFVYDEDKTACDDEFINSINSLRKRAIKPLLDFKDAFVGTALDRARAIVNLFEESQAKKSFARFSAEYKAKGNSVYCDACRQGWDMLMQILDSLSLCFGEAQVTTAEFFEALKTSLELESVGVIPQMIDEAVFGSADRIRPSRPKYAFIMGANQNVFPRIAQPSGLFVNAEREKLINLGIDIPDKTLGASIDEEFLVYSNVCCAVNELYVSYSSRLADGTTGEPSSFVGDILSALDCRVVEFPAELSEENLPETAEDAFAVLCGKISENGGEASTLLEALGSNASLSERIGNVTKAKTRPDFSISADTAHRLFGNTLYMSPSKFDNFNRCHFMYFCRNGMCAERLQPAEFNAMQRGTMVHYVLQRIIEIHGKEVSKLDAAEISAQVEKLSEEYLDGIKGYRSVETPRMRYLVFTIKRALKYVVERLALEFSQSDFTPVKCELRIGKDGDMPEIKIPVDDGELRLTGIVDRVDSYNGNVRIVDYKTGHRDFKLPDILFGQNMQMLIYLYAVCKSEEYGGIPAGIFYMPSSRDKGDSPAKRRMNGLMPASEQLVRAMDKENSGEFVPKISANPSDSFVKDEDFDKIFEFVENKLKSTANAIFDGKIEANPVDGIDSPACKYCEFATICRIEKEAPMAVPRLSNQDVINEIERQAEANGI